MYTNANVGTWELDWLRRRSISTSAVLSFPATLTALDTTSSRTLLCRYASISPAFESNKPIYIYIIQCHSSFLNNIKGNKVEKLITTNENENRSSNLVLFFFIGLSFVSLSSGFILVNQETN